MAARHTLLVVRLAIFPVSYGISTASLKRFPPKPPGFCGRTARNVTPTQPPCPACGSRRARVAEGRQPGSGNRSRRSREEPSDAGYHARGRARDAAGKTALPEEIDILRRWIAAGAAWDATAPADAKPAPWWSFRKPVRPAVPELHDAWVRTPIDAFILKALR